MIGKEIQNGGTINETDWIQMAKFQAERCKRFFDVIVQYMM